MTEWVHNCSFYPTFILLECSKIKIEFKMFKSNDVSVHSLCLENVILEVLVFSLVSPLLIKTFIIHLKISIYPNVL